MGTHYYEVSPLLHGGHEGFSFTYSSGEELPVGGFVEVPFGRRHSLGVVLRASTKPEFATKAVGVVHDEVPMLPASTLELAAWLHEYYVASTKAVWQTLLPAGIEKKARASTPKPGKAASPHPLPPLTDEQTAALTQLRTANRPTLLQGITGSGKTRVYIERAQDMLQAGKSVIILIPEIALTPQLVEVFTRVFGAAVMAQHSKLTPAQRRNLWLAAARSDEPRIVIGPRSSLFMPVPNLGLIVVDEEHEASYKQSQAPRYHAVTVAAKIAELRQAQLVLGSATPALQELWLTTQGRLELATLTKRANGQPAPATTIIDLRDKTNLRESRFLSQPLLEALRATLAEQRQSLLFINRRGSASSQICGDCGHTRLCPNCSIPLTFHADRLELICHYCNRHARPNATCEACGSANLRYLGGGTKRIEAEVRRLLPTARLARLDRDSATLATIESVHTGLHDGSIDILIGTQMVAKGLDIGNLDVVGIVSADTALHFPDYTASERTYQLLSQVIGRAGRAAQPGRAYLQTYTPHHPAIVAAADHDPAEFAAAELAERKLLRYPPFVYMLKLQCQLSTQAAAKQKAEALATELAGTPGITILGPAPAFMEHLRGAYHWQIIIKSADRGRLVTIAKTVPSGWTIDLDPINLL